MKKTLVVIGGLFVLLVVAIFGIFFITSGIVKTADDFFQQVSDGNFKKSRDFLAEEFKAATSPEEFEVFLTESALIDFKEASWNSRSVANGSGELEGVVLTKSGGSIPVQMSFVKELGAWKIYAIQKKGAGLNAAATEDVPIPTKAEAAVLIKDTTRDFAAAINSKDYTQFHADLAKEFQEQVPLEKFNEIFSVFIESEVDLSVLENLQPMFTAEPALSAEGVLLLEGYFASKPSRVKFSYKYVLRGTKWELLGIVVNIEPIDG
ncbi:hypothetical protein [Bythopirellula polymerisocia]|uniref:Lumazine-binding domain protein n=1 Tax=Bythopirellula polymerisocia TaxID=2528003 RepID=A0A5C6CL30_9BACT|nr:hypothetical protein [Bythopirellula polymerisocia]TWU25573.1 hypothetical protein Pla144_27800 [Bythopirellula polymerisocia]